MKRRDFIKSGLASVATASAIDPSGPAIGQAITPVTQGSYEERQQLVLSNQYLDSEFRDLSGGSITSQGFRNK